MSDPKPIDDLQALVDRALAANAPHAIHQDTIARANRLVAIIQPAALPPDAPARDSHGADLKP